MTKHKDETAVDGHRYRIAYPSCRREGARQIRKSFAATILLLAGLLPSLAIAEAEDERIARVKAAFILNIVRFVSWPKEALAHQDNQLMLCLYRNNPLGEALHTIEGKIVNGRQVRINPIESLAQSDPCNILLIGPDEMEHYEKESPHASDRPLLTIADLTAPDSPPSHQHELVTLVRNGARIGFEINLAKARKIGLQLSSNLLKLAKIVGDGT